MPKKLVRPSVSNRIKSVMCSNQFNKELEKIRSLWSKHGINKEIDLRKKWVSNGAKLEEF